MPLESHEPRERVPEEVHDQTRAFSTVIEELEAVAWYNERAAATGDEELKAIMIHHRDEEIEHAMMGLEWLRRKLPIVDSMMRTYLFTDQNLNDLEEGHAGGHEGPEDSGGSLGIGSLRKDQ